MFPVIELEGFPKISSNRAFGVDVENRVRYQTDSSSVHVSAVKVLHLVSRCDFADR